LILIVDFIIRNDSIELIFLYRCKSGMWIFYEITFQQFRIFLAKYFVMRNLLSKLAKFFKHDLLFN